MKKTRNDHSDWLRAYLGWSLVLHIIFFILSLVFVGFWPMIMNLLLATYCYSCYLTLRVVQIVPYFIFLILAIACAFDDITSPPSNAKPLTAMQMFGIFIEGVAYSLILFYDARMFWQFYKLGGIKAYRDNNKPLLGE